MAISEGLFLSGGSLSFLCRNETFTFVLLQFFCFYVPINYKSFYIAFQSNNNNGKISVINSNILTLQRFSETGFSAIPIG